MSLIRMFLSSPYFQLQSYFKKIIYLFIYLTMDKEK